MQSVHRVSVCVPCMQSVHRVPRAHTSCAWVGQHPAHTAMPSRDEPRVHSEPYPTVCAACNPSRDESYPNPNSCRPPFQLLTLNSSSLSVRLLSVRLGTTRVRSSCIRLGLGLGLGPECDPHPTKAQARGAHGHHQSASCIHPMGAESIISNPQTSNA